ncbi:MAG TPA: bifunctional ornithine acetyltransferase/N-acetylglutamate synthase, partial [Caulobacteraceae bacterium]
MTRSPVSKSPIAKLAKAAPRTTAAKALEAAVKPAEIVGQTIERALDPLASALKRAALNRAERHSRQFPSAAPAPAAPAGKPG